MTKCIKFILSIFILFSLSGCTSNPLAETHNHSYNVNHFNSAEIALTPSDSSEINKFITIGSSKNEVAEIQGTPKSIHNYGIRDDWRYHDGSSITFDYGKVSAWSNNGILKVSLTNTNFISTERLSNQKQYNNHFDTKSIAENGSYYGQISERTGRPKTKHVRGHYRKDGTYVRGHYKS